MSHYTPDDLNAAVVTGVEWTDADTASYSAERASVNGYTVLVCLDDEGPLTPAYYWVITDDRVELDGTLTAVDKSIVADGWASTVGAARVHALNRAAILPTR